MKFKIMCLALLGLTICGSVFAEISVEDRKSFCENADGFVWVEKTQACIPENPCKSEVLSIKAKSAYCKKDDFYKVANMDRLIDRYAQLRAGSPIKDITQIEESDAEEYSVAGINYVKRVFYKVNTVDGNYMVLDITVLPEDEIYGSIIDAFKVYGIVPDKVDVDVVNVSLSDTIADGGRAFDSEYIDGVFYRTVKSWMHVDKEATCRAAADFASALDNGKWIKYSYTDDKYQTDNCKLMIAASEAE